MSVTVVVETFTSDAIQCQVVTYEQEQTFSMSQPFPFNFVAYDFS